jgi:hypothetical protein
MLGKIAFVAAVAYAAYFGAAIGTREGTERTNRLYERLISVYDEILADMKAELPPQTKGAEP